MWQAQITKIIFNTLKHLHLRYVADTLIVHNSSLVTTMGLPKSKKDKAPSAAESAFRNSQDFRDHRGARPGVLFLRDDAVLHRGISLSFIFLRCCTYSMASCEHDLRCRHSA